MAGGMRASTFVRIEGYKREHRQLKMRYEALEAELATLRKNVGEAVERITETTEHHVGYEMTYKMFVEEVKQIATRLKAVRKPTG